MDGIRASDEVIDEIAHIAMLRHEAEKHGGLAAFGSESLRKLHELRDREQKAMQEAENKAVHQANLEALAIEIRKVQQATGGGGGGGRNPEQRNARPRPQQQQQQPRKEGGGGGGHNPSRNKGRRSMGRQGRP